MFYRVFPHFLLSLFQSKCFQLVVEKIKGIKEEPGTKEPVTEVPLLPLLITEDGKLKATGEQVDDVEQHGIVSHNYQDISISKKLHTDGSLNEKEMAKRKLR